MLDGALSLAVPTKKGQSLQFHSNKNSFLQWKSMDENGELWFEAQYSTNNYNILQTSDTSIANHLKIILQKAHELSNQKKTLTGDVTTKLKFPRNWGLGSSSTLISCISQLFRTDPFELHFKVSSGSGYDK